jgi:hypothetical protein
MPSKPTPQPHSAFPTVSTNKKNAEFAQQAGVDANSVPSARGKPQLASLLGYGENKLGAEVSARDIILNSYRSAKRSVITLKMYNGKTGTPKIKI